MFKKMLLATILCATGLSIQSKSPLENLKEKFSNMKEAFSNVGEKMFYSQPATAFRDCVRSAYHNAKNRENIFRQARETFRNSEAGKTYNKASDALDGFIYKLIKRLKNR